MAVSSHRIHTIHGAFGAPSCFAPSMPLAINPAQASSFTRIPNVCAPRSRPFRPGPGPAAAAPPSRTAPMSAAPSIMGPSSASGSRPRRTSLSFSSPTPTRRAPPPPPAPLERTASALPTATAPVVQIPTIEDPFADALTEDDAPLTPLPLPPSSTYSRNRVTVSTYTVPVDGSNSASGSRGTMATGLSAPPGLAHMASNGISIPSAKDMRGRLVASVLLSRGSGRPLGTYLRRRLSGQEHVYVKSGLSQLVAAAA